MFKRAESFSRMSSLTGLDADSKELASVYGTNGLQERTHWAGIVVRLTRCRSPEDKLYYLKNKDFWSHNKQKFAVYIDQQQAYSKVEIDGIERFRS